METTKQNDFLEREKPGKLMARYAVPCKISLLVAALYNIVDQIFIANAPYLGSYGNSGEHSRLPADSHRARLRRTYRRRMLRVCQHKPRRRRGEDAENSVTNAIILSLAVSAVLTAVYLIFPDAIITAFGGRVNDETFRCAKEYFFWISLGIPFYVFGQAMNPIIRSDGSPRFAMACTLAGALVNVILDPIFIYPMKMGMAGAAIATILGQILTAALSVWYLAHMKTIKLTKKSFTLKKPLYSRFLPLGITSFIAQIALVLSMAAFQNVA